MNQKFIWLLFCGAFSFCICACKSEADKVVHKACSVDLSQEENQDNCAKAIEEYCGESSSEAVSIQKNIWGLESFRILNALNKGDPEKGARIKEDQKKSLRKNGTNWPCLLLVKMP